MFLIEIILILINKEILAFLNKVHEKYPETSIDEMRNMWYVQQGLPSETSIDDETDFPKKAPKTQGKQPNSELKTCQYMFIKGKNANAQCKTKVKRNGDYCSKHVQNYTELEKRAVQEMQQQSDSSETELEKQQSDSENES